ncbi:hypothetical protein XENORESO_000783 [Xenotaenia resolanae]|uniref:Uncharacterized protein n=1 Tax=Xenotaenia resolanae TaxID=208358 RepID=A0ABV0VL52_9TELE
MLPTTQQCDNIHRSQNNVSDFMPCVCSYHTQPTKVKSDCTKCRVTRITAKPGADNERSNKISRNAVCLVYDSVSQRHLEEMYACVLAKKAATVNAKHKRVNKNFFLLEPLYENLGFL